MQWPPELDHELSQAREARLRGNEGRARVCARRAVGIAARLYLGARGIPVASASVLDILDQLIADPAIDDDVRKLAALFVLHVDQDFRLPAGVDLIAEAGNLCRQLLA